MKSFAEFWPYYLAEHRSPICRALHYLGTISAIFCLLVLLAVQAYSLVPIVLLLGYGPAWIGHFYFEKNRPASFRYPWLSFKADFVMCFFWLTGRLEGQLKASAEIYKAPKN